MTVLQHLGETQKFYILTVSQNTLKQCLWWNTQLLTAHTGAVFQFLYLFFSIHDTCLQAVLLVAFSLLFIWLQRRTFSSSKQLGSAEQGDRGHSRHKTRDCFMCSLFSKQRCDESACTQASGPKKNDFVIFFPGFYFLFRFFALILPLLYFNHYLTNI